MGRRAEAGNSRIDNDIRKYTGVYIRKNSGINIRRYICTCVCLLLSLHFFRAGIQYSQVLYSGEKALSLICSEGITVVGAEDFLREELQRDSEGSEGDGQEESLYPVFWKELKDQRIQNEELAGSVQVNVIYAVGNTELLCREGNLLSQGDTSGCLLDEETAEKLFGYGDPCGGRIVCGGREYEIRGVIKDQKEILIVQVSQSAVDDTLQLDRITADADDKRQEVLLETVKNRYGISGTRLEWNLLYGISRGILLLLPLAAALTLICRVKRIIRKAGEKTEKLFWRLCLFAIVLCVGVCVVKQIRIPAEMIPSTWSDFDFWAMLWDEKKEALRFLMEAEKSSLERQYFEAFFQSAICGNMSLISYLLGYGFF